MKSVFIVIKRLVRIIEAQDTLLATYRTGSLKPPERALGTLVHKQVWLDDANEVVKEAKGIA